MATAPAPAPTPAAAPAAGDAPPPKKKKGKLLIIIVVAVVVLALLGVGAVLLLKKKGASSASAHDEHPVEAAKPPVFHPLDTFTVNLADKDRERFLQVNISLEVKDAKVADRIKAFNPAVRDRVLMLLSSQTADQLSSIEGKEKLARQIASAINRVIAAELPSDTPRAEMPVIAAHFSSFVVQ